MVTLIKDMGPIYGTQVAYALVHRIFATKCSNETSNRFKRILNEYGVDVVLPSTCLRPQKAETFDYLNHYQL
jgi:hypothetical protein